MKNEKIVEKVKFPGRVQLICQRCEDVFSTHSSNRKVCHKCKPKCREKHYFDGNYQTNNDIKVTVISDSNVAASITDSAVEKQTADVE